MSKIIFDQNIMKIVSLAESMTGAVVKDCIVNDKILFIIKETDIGKAIGKKGSNIRRLEGLLKKKIKMVEFSDDPAQFIRNYLYPLEVNEIVKEDLMITIYGKDTKTKGLIIGRDKANLNFLKDVVNRYFKVDEIKVI